VSIPDRRHNNMRGKSTTASQLSAKASVSEVCFPVSVFISSDKGRKHTMDRHRNGDYIKTQEWVKYVLISVKFLKFSFSLSKFFVVFFLSNFEIHLSFLQMLSKLIWHQ